MEEEVPADDEFPASGGELVLDRQVLMTGKDAFQEGLFLEPGQEVTGDGIFALDLVGALDLRKGAARHGSLVGPEADMGPPDLIGVEGYVHAQDDGKAFLEFFLESFDLRLGNIAEDVFERDEIDPVHNLGLEGDVKGIDLLEPFPGKILEGGSVKKLN